MVQLSHSSDYSDQKTPVPWEYLCVKLHLSSIIVMLKYKYYGNTGKKVAFHILLNELSKFRCHWETDASGHFRNHSHYYSNDCRFKGYAVAS